MILALEGPDRAGKTSVFELLKPHLPDARFVPSLSMPEGVPPGLLVSRLAQLWEVLYEPKKLYVCDRSLFVSGPVYAKVLSSEFLYNWRQWVPRLRVVYIDTLDALIEARCRATGEYFSLHRLHQVRECYGDVLREFECLKLDGSRPSCDLAEEVLRWL